MNPLDFTCFRRPPVWLRTTASILRFHTLRVTQKGVMVLLKFLLDRFQVLAVVDQVGSFVFR